MTSRKSLPGGFTLLEILLVVLVIGIAAAAFVPVGLESLDASRTRSAVRDIIGLNRYARSRAILDRRPVAMVYLTGQDRLQLLSLPPERDVIGSTLFDSGRESGEGAEIAGTPEMIRSRELPDYVKIRDVDGAAREEDGYFVIYEKSGQSRSHSLEITGPRGDRHRLAVNGLTGEIRLDD